MQMLLTCRFYECLQALAFWGGVLADPETPAPLAGLACDMWAEIQAEAIGWASR